MSAMNTPLSPECGRHLWTVPKVTTLTATKLLDSDGVEYTTYKYDDEYSTRTSTGTARIKYTRVRVLKNRKSSST